ncbi:PP2C family protein-serine/threonine phosphatase [Exiguobacterium sp. LL15]|uniref:PP2C family protein-serine/threonine phosphatase n=1 Tax=Exiguobacterium sp. LL15 TaxID=2950547 RepID=UPI0021092916|nr:PP2C family protein-serine/threonine phosphatase [Exiguobacterium sp. LL15]MCQ4090904.1 serine/threonine-protein phosphatase [Exiguobacterium sp. LL15]
MLARVRNAIGLKQAIDARKRYEKVLQEDFDLAQKLQQSVLSANIEDDEIRIMATYIPSKKLAGDMYAWYRISQNKYGIILFDVMGHGVSSALITMGMSSILFELVHRIGDPAQVLEELNQQMSRLFPGDETEIYFTAVYLYIDLDEMKLSYANAGHPPGLLRMNDRIIPLENTGLPVGMFEDSTYSSKTIDIVSPGCVYLYTDGFMELYSKGIDEGIHAIQNLIEQQGPNIHQLIQPDQSDEADDLCLVTVEIN